MGFPKERDSATESRAESGPGSKMWSPYDDGPRSRTPLWFALGGLAVLGVLVAGLMLMWNTGGPDPSAEAEGRQTTSAVAQPLTPEGKYVFAGTRTTDPEPLTVKEIFGKKKVGAYSQTITNLAKKCADATVGDKLHKALKSGKCTQVVRASFRDKDGKVLATIGLANLKDSKSAETVAKSIGKGELESYVKPLPGKDEVSKFLGSGQASAKIWTHGHYAIMVWVQYKDGHKPSKDETAKLFKVVTDLSKATVFEALDTRTLTGRPAG